MTLLRPTLQGRAGFNPNGYGAGVESPFGRSSGYKDGTVTHHGEDYFWLGPASAAALGISSADSQYVFPVADGIAHAIYTDGLGYGYWQQLDSNTRAYYWHLSSQLAADGAPCDVSHAIGVMGHTGSAAGPYTHLHFEIRVAPYGEDQRVDPEPYFRALAANQRRTASWPVGFRAYADLNSANIAFTLPPGTVVDCVWWQYGDGGGSGENRFFLVRYNGQQGYVHIGDVLGSGVAGVPEYEGQRKPDLTDEQRARYRAIAAYVNTHADNLGLDRTATANDGLPSPSYWKLVQGLGRAWDFYAGAVDGVPGDLTYAAEEHIWASWVNPPVPAPQDPAPDPEPPTPDPVDPNPEPPAPEDPAPVDPEPGPVPPPPTRPVLGGWAGGIAAIVTFIVGLVAAIAAGWGK